MGNGEGYDPKVALPSVRKAVPPEVRDAFPPLTYSVP